MTNSKLNVTMVNTIGWYYRPIVIIIVIFKTTRLADITARVVIITVRNCKMEQKPRNDRFLFHPQRGFVELVFKLEMRHTSASHPIS